MTKPRIFESRFDFRKGRNTAISPDLLNVDELVDTTNARLSVSYGAFSKRSGCQRIHNAAFPAAVRGVVQWDGPSGKQIVVISNGHLFYRNGFTYATAFTDEGTAPFSTTDPAFFMPFRDSSSGAPLVLFIASGGKLMKWTGTVLSDVTSTTTAADRLIAYHTRAFARNQNFKKNIFWSKVGDATTFATGTKTDGGSAMVDVLNGEEIVALEVIGSSLLMAAEDSVMRFTGHASDDIVIQQDTEGVSSEVGAVGPLALKRFENVAGMLSERGPFAVTETHVEPIGEQIGPDFTALDLSNISKSVVGWNRGRKELLFAVPGASDSGLNKTVFVQAARLQAWYGPWSYSFGITYFARYERSDGDESILSGGADGYVRDMDVGVLDDVFYDGSVGSNITMTVEMPVLQFGLPGIVKALWTMSLQADLPSGSALAVKIAFDGGAFTTFTALATSGLQHQRLDVNGQGKRLRLQFVDSTAQLVTVAGFLLEGWNYERP